MRSRRRTASRPYNPLTWLAGNALVVCFLLQWDRPVTPALSLGLVAALGYRCGVDGATQWKRLAPFGFLASIWVVTSTLFYVPPAGLEPRQWFMIGPFSVYREGLEWGILRAMRLLVMIAFGSLVLEKITPGDLVLSLSQNLRLPYRIAFTLQAAYRMIPVLSEEARQVHRAQSVRRIRPAQTALDRLHELASMARPLLAGALRRADRMALAMESRGFGAFPVRTYRRRIGFGARDAALFLVLLLACFALTFLDRIAS